VSKQLAKINRKLKKIENRIDYNLQKAWYENGLLLLEIQETKLYKAKYKSFENYLEERFNMKPRNGYHLINASKTYQILEKNTEESVNKNGEFVHTLLPKNEAQIRPLLQLENDSERVYVWNHLVESEIKPTMAKVTEAVKEFQNNPIDVEVIEIIETDYIDVEVATVRLHTGDNESYTPLEYLESARKVMGNICVDPASNPFANKRVNADIHYTEETNGLDKEWSGNIWLNPPYASKLINQFVAKLIEEYEAGRCKQAILLTNNSADTKWFHDSARYSSAICLTKGRINFYKADDTTTSPTNGQTFFYFGDNVEAFTEEFKKYGMIVKVLEDAE